MHPKTKIQLSEFEQQLMLNADWILTKNAIIEKMKELLQECLDLQIEILHKKKTLLPEEIFKSSPKISKGENYKGLPWLMLDYPRQFDKENIFAIRTFFWWGQCFSITLHFSGRYKILFSKKIIAAYQSLIDHQFYCCINSDEWEHHFEEDNYKMIHHFNEKEFQQIIIEKKFIKLSVKINLSEWHKLPLLSSALYKFLLEVLA